MSTQQTPYGAHSLGATTQPYGQMSSTPFIPSTPNRGGRPPAKRGRKPRGGATSVGPNSPRMTPEAFSTSSPLSTTPQYSVQWAMPGGATTGASPSTFGENKAASASPVIPATSSPLNTTSHPTPLTAATIPQPPTTGYTTQPSTSQSSASPVLPVPVSTLLNTSSTFGTTASSLDSTGLLTFSSTGPSGLAGRGTPLGTRPSGIDEDGEGEDELLPAMADDDYSAQQSWQSQSKDNLKVLMDNFSPGQYERFEAYRRHALPKQAVRKVIQQTTGQQVSQPVAQIVAGFAKVFVGEIVERARAVQARRRERGPLTPDHLREAYRLYQEETGRVGSARPIRSKRLFSR